jgi:hypothetical protein
MKIGINLVGITYGDVRDRNWKNTKDNLMSTIINCWGDNEVKMYLTTYDNPTINDLVSFYTPTKLTLIPYEGSDQRTTYIKSLKELLEEDLDVIISTRFDIEFNKPLSENNIDFNKFNFFFKEANGWWERHLFTNDALFIFNKKYLNDFIDSVVEFDTNPYRPPNHKDLHPTYRYLVPKIGEENTHFILKTHHLTHRNPHYKLIRTGSWQ